MTPSAQTAFNAAQAAFDKAVENLSPEDYKEVAEEMTSHTESCMDCIRADHPHLFE